MNKKIEKNIQEEKINNSWIILEENKIDTFATFLKEVEIIIKKELEKNTVLLWYEKWFEFALDNLTETIEDFKKITVSLSTKSSEEVNNITDEFLDLLNNSKENLIIKIAKLKNDSLFDLSNIQASVSINDEDFKKELDKELKKYYKSLEKIIFSYIDDIKKINKDLKEEIKYFDTLWKNEEKDKNSYFNSLLEDNGVALRTITYSMLDEDLEENKLSSKQVEVLKETLLQIVLELLSWIEDLDIEKEEENIKNSLLEWKNPLEIFTWYLK